nr:sn1 specific diacylglycerol lipase beta [Hymenolepis microstoma]
MPAIILFGRGWRFSSDDFVLSSLFAISLRLIGLILAILPTCLYWKYEPHLPNLVLTVLSFAVILDSLQIFLRCNIAYLSSQGGIAEIEKRKHVPSLLYFDLIFKICELIVYSFLLYVETFLTNCLSKACVYIRAACIYGIFLVVCDLLLFLTTYDSTSRVWRHHPNIWCMEEGSNSQRLNKIQAHRLVARLWHRRIRCLACVGNSCGRLDIDTKISNTNAMAMVSELVGTYFMTNLVATDLLAGLMLLRWQTHQWVDCGNSVSLERVLQDSYPYDPVTNPPYPSHVRPIIQQEMESPFDRLAYDWLSIRRLWIYSKHVTAVYGSLLYLISKRLSPTAISSLCKYLQCPENTACCCCCCGSRQREDDSETSPFFYQPHTIAMSCCLCRHDTCNLAVYQEITDKPLESLVYYSFSNDVYKSPFFVAFDDESESIVVSIRGTLSVEDAIVDMLIEGNHLTLDEIPADVPVEDHADFFVHMGMLSSARNIRDMILRGQLVEKARVRRPNYPLVICGHSLGAGVASVLALLLKKLYPEVKAYAYSPPLGLMSSKMARYCKPFVVSIILGYDIVPRLSVPTLNDLKWRLLSALQDCSVPKYRILSNAARILSLNCILSTRRNASSIGLDSSLFDSTTQYKLLHPSVYNPLGASTTAFSADAASLMQEDGRTTDEVTADGQPNASSSNANRPVRYLPERRSLFRWLRNKNDVLLKTNSSRTSDLPLVVLKGYDNSTASNGDSNDTSETTGVYQDLVSMDTSVRFAGLTLHIVEVEDSDFNISASTMPGSWNQYRGKCPPVAIWTNSHQFQSILVHPRMLLDHFPDGVSSALYRIYSAYSQRDSPFCMVGANGSALDAKGLIRRIKKSSN